VNVLSHEDACDLLRRAAFDLDTKRISLRQWHSRVTDILDRRFPDEPERRKALRHVAGAMARATSTNTEPATARRVGAGIAARRPAH